MSVVVTHEGQVFPFAVTGPPEGWKRTRLSPERARELADGYYPTASHRSRKELARQFRLLDEIGPVLSWESGLHPES